MTLALGWMWVAPIFFFLPFLSKKLLNNGIIKNCIAIFIVLGLWPFFSSRTSATQGIGLVEALLYEFIIGLVLTFIIILPFLIANVIGEIIDNQRGAMIAKES